MTITGQNCWISGNQIGYLEDDVKVAVCISSCQLRSPGACFMHIRQVTVTGGATDLDGMNPKRTDKLYNRLDELIKELKNRGYRLVRIDELLKE